MIVRISIHLVMVISKTPIILGPPAKAALRWINDRRHLTETDQRTRSWRAFLHQAGIFWLHATAWWSWSDSNQQPECYGKWFESDQLHHAVACNRRIPALWERPPGRTER